MVNASVLIIPKIETPDVLELVDEIAALDGIDSLVIGTNDLTAEMGAPGDYESQGPLRLISATSTLAKSLATGLDLAVFTPA